MYHATKLDKVTDVSNGSSGGVFAALVSVICSVNLTIVELSFQIAT